MNMATRLRQWRNGAGKTQEQLGVLVGVSGMTVSRWELGVSLPQPKYWDRLAEATGIPIDELIKSGVAARQKPRDGAAA